MDQKIVDLSIVVEQEISAIFKKYRKKFTDGKIEYYSMVTIFNNAIASFIAWYITELWPEETVEAQRRFISHIFKESNDFLDKFKQVKNEQMD